MSESAPASRRYLDPFAFPSETDTLFALLIITALMIAVNYSFFLSGFLQNSETKISPVETLIVSSAACLFTLLTAFVVFRLYPRLIVRRNSLEYFDRREHDAFYRSLSEKVRGADVLTEPQVLRQRSRSDTALAFGTGSRPLLRLDSGVLVLQLKDPRRFWALVLHELAHLKHKDVGRYYFSKSLTLTVLLFFSLPLILLVAGTFASTLSLESDWRKPAYTALFVLQAVAMIGLFALIEAKLLRVREFYADYRAASWGARKPLTEILATEAEKETSRGFLGKFTVFHPSSKARLEKLLDTVSISSLDRGLPFISGVLLTVLMQGMFLVVLPSLSIIIGKVTDFGNRYIAYVESTNDYSATRPVSILTTLFFVGLVATVFGILFFLGYLTVRSLAVSLVRASLADLLDEGPRKVTSARLLSLALLTTLGYELGFLLMPFAPFVPRSFSQFGILVLIMLVTLFFSWLVLIFTKYFGQRLFKSQVGNVLPAWKLRPFLILLTTLFCLSLLPQLSFRLSLLEGDSTVFSSAIIFMVWATALVYLIVFGVSWIVMILWESVVPGRCRDCRERAPGGVSIGKFCGNCGTILAPWLYMQEKQLL